MANKRLTTPAQVANIVSSVIVSLIIVLTGVLMLLSGFNVIKVDLNEFWLPLLLFALFAVGFTLGVFRKSTAYLWFAFVFLVCGIAVLINLTSGVSYDRIYPLFIAAPALASALIVFFADNKKLHLQSVILFSGLAIVFLLQSMQWIRSWWIIGGIAVVMVGLFAFVSVMTSRRGRWDDGDRPQRQRGKKWDDGDRPQSDPERSEDK